MSTLSIEERLTALEQEVERLRCGRHEVESNLPWWKEIRGAFKDDPTYEEAMRYGREYRESLRPAPDEDPA